MSTVKGFGTLHSFSMRHQLSKCSEMWWRGVKAYTMFLFLLPQGSVAHLHCLPYSCFFFSFFFWRISNKYKDFPWMLKIYEKASTAEAHQVGIAVITNFWFMKKEKKKRTVFPVGNGESSEIFLILQRMVSFEKNGTMTVASTTEVSSRENLTLYV